MRVWARRVGWMLLACVGMFLLACAARIAPLFEDDMALDRIVVAVALDWRDFGRETAEQRLQYELDHGGIGSQVTDADCALEEGAESVRTVRCGWEMEVLVPATEVRIPMSFSSVARVDRNGALLP